MIYADEYAPPRAIVGVTVVGLLLAGLGIAIYFRPSVGWAMARLRMGRDEIDSQRREHGDTGFRWFGIALVLGGLIMIGVAIKQAVT